MRIPAVNKDLGPAELRTHVLDTYLSLRRGIAVAGISPPLILAIGGKLWAKIDLQPSMSDYYHAVNHGRTMRDWFVGILFVVSLFLYLYKGFSKIENRVLNAAGVLGLGIALNPASQVEGAKLTLHGFCAVSFFLCIAFVCFFCADDTLTLISDVKRQERLRMQYRGIAIAMVLSMAGAWLLNALHKTGVGIFFVEAAGVLSFGYYWWTKSNELKETSAAAQAVEGKLRNLNGHVKRAA